MAGSVNRVILLGNLGRDAELSYTTAGQPVSKFTLATNRRWKDSKTGEWQDETEWHNIVLWGKSAETLTQYLQKGKKVYVEGRIKSRTWEGKDGAKHYATDIVADRITLISARGEESAASGAGAAAPARPAAAPAPAAARDEGITAEITDEDIPF
jgi:single-strand DNA-binding protein